MHHQSNTVSAAGAGGMLLTGTTHYAPHSHAGGHPAQQQPYAVHYPPMADAVYATQLGGTAPTGYSTGYGPHGHSMRPPVGIEMSETFHAEPTDAVAHAGYGLVPGEAAKDVQARHSIDVPSFKSLSGCVIILILLMTVVSLATCLGRADFNFVFYLLGYLVWCLDAEQVTLTPYTFGPLAGDRRGAFASEPRALRNEFTPTWVTSYLCSRKMYRAVQQFTFVLLAAALVDSFWLLLAHSTWLCDVDTATTTAAVTAVTGGIHIAGTESSIANMVVGAASRYLSPSAMFNAVAELAAGTKGGEDASAVAVLPTVPPPLLGPTWCFTGENQQMAFVFGMHRFVLFTSSVNTVLKILAVSLSFVWLSGQKKFLNASGRSR